MTDKQRAALEAGRNVFSSENQPANRGRKPSKLKKWIKENNVANEDFIGIFKNIIATHTIEELQKMIEGDNENKLPVIVALCISAFIHDMKTGTLTAANSVLDRIIGKPHQSVAITASGSIDISGMSIEERYKRIQGLLRKMADHGSTVKTD